MHKVAKLLRLVSKIVSERPDEVRRGIDKAARTADQKTGGRYSSRINRGVRTANKYLERRGHQRPH